jgi:hypothetical protein
MMLHPAGLGIYEYGAAIQDTPVGGVQVVNAFSGAAIPWWCTLWAYSEACHPTGTMPVTKPLAPVAPQTYNQMTVPGAWTPVEASAWTAYVQSQVRAAEEYTYQTAMDATTGGAGAAPAQDSPSSTGLLIVAAVAAVGLFMALRK